VDTRSPGDRSCVVDCVTLPKIAWGHQEEALQRFVERGAAVIDSLSYPFCSTLARCFPVVLCVLLY